MAGPKFLAPCYYGQRAVFASLRALFSFIINLKAKIIIKTKFFIVTDVITCGLYSMLIVIFTFL